MRVSDALGDGPPATSRSGRTASRSSSRCRSCASSCDADDHGLGLRPDVARLVPGRRGAAPRLRQGPQVILDACRFAQVGTWEGALRVDDRTWERRRPTRGSAPATGRGASGPSASPSRRAGPRPRAARLRASGGPTCRCASTTSPSCSSSRRTATATARSTTPCGCGPTGGPSSSAGRRSRSATRSGTRHPDGATITAEAEDGKPLVIEVETLGFVAAQRGLGLRRRPRVDPRPVDGPGLGRAASSTTSPTPRSPARCRSRGRPRRPGHLDGAEGWGLFEHGTIGPTTPAASPTSARWPLASRVPAGLTAGPPALQGNDGWRRRTVGTARTGRRRIARRLSGG